MAEAAPRRGGCGGGPAVTLPGPRAPGWGVAGASSARSGLLGSHRGRGPSALARTPEQPRGEPRARPVNLHKAFCASAGRTRLQPRPFSSGSVPTSCLLRSPAMAGSAESSAASGRAVCRLPVLREKPARSEPLRRELGVRTEAEPWAAVPAQAATAPQRRHRVKEEKAECVLLVFAVIFPVAKSLIIQDAKCS